jgi:hypothetical protein
MDLHPKNIFNQKIVAFQKEQREFRYKAMI